MSDDDEIPNIGTPRVDTEPAPMSLEHLLRAIFARVTDAADLSRPMLMEAGSTPVEDLVREFVGRTAQAANDGYAWGASTPNFLAFRDGIGQPCCYREDDVRGVLKTEMHDAIGGTRTGLTLIIKGVVGGVCVHPDDTEAVELFFPTLGERIK